MAESAVRITTGSLSFEGGVDSNRVPTIASESYPTGLKPNMCAWLENATVRGGGISPRRGWKRLLEMPVTALFQECSMYEPDEGFPYIVAQIGGRTFAVRVDGDNSVQEITIPGDPNSATIDQSWMCQGEQFLVIQDGTALPLFYDGTSMRRSKGPGNVLGVVSVAFVVPAVGQVVNVTLTDPYAGQPGERIYINGKVYQQAEASSFITLKNVSSPFTGTVMPTGTRVFNGSTVNLVTTAPFTVPATGGSVNITVSPDYAGAVPVNVAVQNDLPQFTITAIGVAPPAPNHVLLVNITDTPGVNVPLLSVLNSVAELPTATCMDYYMGRLWSANGREYIAGDIVLGPSGTEQYGYRDAILKLTENEYLALGGAFVVPTNAGNIRALKHPTNLDTALGQGQLLVFTRKTIYSVNVTPTRAEWQTLSEPIQRVAQTNFGTTSDRSVVNVNGDLFYQSVDGVRSLTQAIRYFNQWGNVPISSEETRITDLNDRALLRFGSGIEFDNRLLQTCLPFQTDVGVCHKGLMPLDFDLISTLAERLPPAWEGVQQGLDILRVVTGDFGGLQRSFAFVRSALGKIELWELTQNLLEDRNLSGDARLTWVVETPSYTWDKLFKLKELDTLEMWVDKLSGTVDFTIYFRPDQHPCWEYWHHWQVCAARNECELPYAPVPCNYPQQPYRQLYKATMVMPKPPTTCGIGSGRPLNIGYSFQFRIVIHGFCRVRGLLVHGLERDKQPYLGITC